MRNVILVFFFVVFAGCASHPQTPLIGVMIDNHEYARAYQRGLEKAPLVMEQLVEGYITRFLAFLDPADLPGDIGPVRSVRPYFIDGSTPVLSAIFHVGGSPEALEKLQKSDAAESFNAISGYDSFFSYDDDAPAPHNRFLSRENILDLLSQKTASASYINPDFHFGSFVPDEPAKIIDINYYSPLHNVTYSYDAKTKSYTKESGGEIRPPSPQNIVIIETDVSVVGPFGRLGIRMQGSGSAILFRDGGMQRGSWSKSGPDHFFTFSDAQGKPLSFHKGQIWMIVLDSLDRVT